LDLARELGVERGAGVTLLNLSDIARVQGEAARARYLAQESLALFRHVEDQWGMVEALNLIAVNSVAERSRAAARLFGAAAATRECIGSTLPETERAAFEHADAIARSSLGEDTFAAAWEEGRALPLEEAVVEAVMLAEELKSEVC
jgi:hypothetical protein